MSMTHAQIADPILSPTLSCDLSRCRQWWSLRRKLKSRRLMPPITAWFGVGVPTPMTGVQASSALCSSLDWMCLTVRFIASVCITAQMQTLAFQARVDETSDCSRSCLSGYEEGSSAEYKRDCNRKSCGVPVAIDNADHASSSAIESEETVLCECHSGNCLDGTPDGNKSFTTTCGVAACGSMAASPTPGSKRTPTDTFGSSWCLGRRESSSLSCGIVFYWETQGTAEPTTPRRVTSCTVVSMSLRRRYLRQLAQDPGQFDWEGRVRCRPAWAIHQSVPECDLAQTVPCNVEVCREPLQDIWTDWAYDVVSEPHVKNVDDPTVAGLMADGCAAVQWIDPATPCIVGPAPFCQNCGSSTQSRLHANTYWRRERRTKKQQGCCLWLKCLKKAHSHDYTLTPTEGEREEQKNNKGVFAQARSARCFVTVGARP